MSEGGREETQEGGRESICNSYPHSSRGMSGFGERESVNLFMGAKGVQGGGGRGWREYILSCINFLPFLSLCMA